MSLLLLYRPRVVESFRGYVPTPKTEKRKKIKLPRATIKAIKSLEEIQAQDQFSDILKSNIEAFKTLQNEVGNLADALKNADISLLIALGELALKIQRQLEEEEILLFLGLSDD